MAEECVGVWKVRGRERMPSGKWGLVTQCPVCKAKVVQPRYALLRNKRCQRCFIDAVYKGGNRTARHKVKYNLQNNQSKKRGIELNLSDEQLDVLWASNCHYCGMPPSNKMTAVRSNGKTEEFIYSGLDRQDNTKGYIIDNVVPCCKICNRAKESLSVDEFLKWIERVYHGTR